MLAGPNAGGRRFNASRFWRLVPGNMPRRFWLFRWFDRLARLRPVWGKKSGLMVVRMDGIGDMVLFRPALDHYADVFGVKKSDIVVIGCHSWKGLAESVFAGYRVITINEHRYAKRLLYRFRINWMIRGLNVHTATVDHFMRRSLMSDSLAHVSGAADKIVSLPYISPKTTSEFNWYLSQSSQVIDTGRYPTFEINRHFNFISAIAGREIAPTPPVLAWRDEAPCIEGGAPYVVLNPGSNEPGRRWPLVKYVKIAEKLLDRGLRVVVIGAPGETLEEDVLISLRVRDGFVNLAGKTSLAQVLDLMKHAHLVISNDSGPAHLAIGLGAKTLTIVGGGHFGSFVPYDENVCPDNAAFVYEKMECYHCFWCCPKRDHGGQSFPCVAAVTTDAAWDAVETLIGG